MEKDPVCGMYLIKVEERLTSKYNGSTYYFCCPCCKSSFDSDPAKFLNKQEEHSHKKYDNKIKGDRGYV